MIFTLSERTEQSGTKQGTGKTKYVPVF